LAYAGQELNEKDNAGILADEHIFCFYVMNGLYEKPATVGEIQVRTFER